MRRRRAARGARGCVAAAGWLCALMSALALALLMPLKRVEPFVVRVDSTTGVVDVVPAYRTAVRTLEPSRDALFPHALRHGLRALQLRHRRERLRGMRRVPYRAAQPGLVCAVEPAQSGIAR